MRGSSSSSSNRSFHVGEAPFHVPEISVPTEVPVIPGPAGPIQRALRRRSQNRVNFPKEIVNEPSTQEYVAQVVAEPAPFDTDFYQANWTSAIEFATKQGYMITESEDAIWTSINVIHNTRGDWAKIEKMVCMVKSFTPNGLGDAMVTLKDPTGNIDASIHRKVFQNEEYARTIGVGAVLFLEEVTVVKFMTRTKYVNITVKNVVGVVGKNDMLTNTGGDGEETWVNDEESELLSTVVPDSEDEM